jgi:hypothetical protein
VWTFTDAAIAIIAASTTRDAMYTWWLENAVILSAL